MLNVRYRQAIVTWCQCQLGDQGSWCLGFAGFWNLGTLLQRHAFMNFFVLLIGYVARWISSLENSIKDTLFFRAESRQWLPEFLLPLHRQLWGWKGWADWGNKVSSPLNFIGHSNEVGTAQDPLLWLENRELSQGPDVVATKRVCSLLWNNT